MARGGDGPDRVHGGHWDHGCIKYVYPAGDAESHAPIEGVVVQSSASAKVFTGPGSLSTVDDFYKYCSIQRFACDASKSPTSTRTALLGV